MKGVSGAKPNDVYVDAEGKLWRVVGVCGEPSVIVEEIESGTPDTPIRMSGGMSGLMWQDFERIYSPEEKKGTSDE